MPAKYPRVQVTLSQEARALVVELAELTGRSNSAVVNEVVDMALPALKTMLEAVKIVKGQPLEAQRLMNRFAYSATADLAQAQIDFDKVVSERSGKVKRRRNAST